MIEIDPKDWAAEYGLGSEAEAVKHIGESMQNTAHENWAPLALLEAWPVLRDLAVITGGTPYGPDDAAGAVAALVDAYGLDAVRSQVQVIRHRQAYAVIREHVRAAVAAQNYGPEDVPVAAVFTAYDYEDGTFLDNDTLTVWFADGDSETIEINDRLDALNAALNVDGRCPPDHALAVHLHDNRVEEDDFKSVCEEVSRWVCTFKRSA
jgi:hypothetical protein